MTNYYKVEIAAARFAMDHSHGKHNLIIPRQKLVARAAKFAIRSKWAFNLTTNGEQKPDYFKV